MKKIYSILLFCFICFSLTACEPIPVSYPDDYLIDVERVELINYENSDRSTFDFEKMTIVEELKSEKLDDFIQDISELYMWRRVANCDFENVSIRIIYSNGYFEVISCNNTDKKVISNLVRYDAEGILIKDIGSLEFRSDYVNLINNYFTTQIN